MSSLKTTAKRLARRVLPASALRAIRKAQGRETPLPEIGKVDFGDLRRLRPVSPDYGYSRGRPVDRYYIENFLRDHGGDIKGRVLEIGETTYTREFGKGVTHAEMLHVNDVEGATYVDDLTDGATLPSNHFDCVILCQTLHLIYDMKAALETIYRILKPGGVLLATVPGITQISDEDWNDSWYWSLSTNAANRLFKDVFPPELVDVAGFGNVFAATAFLYGLSDHELSRKELDFLDPEYPVIVAVRAVTAHEGFRRPMEGRWSYEAAPEPFAYDEETSYAKGMAFLHGLSTIEDWGCGTAYAKRFVADGVYRGVDGSQSPFCDVVADLQTYRSETEGVFMRHVLEHNWGWRAILRNAVASFGRRMTLIVFTPFEASERKLMEENGIPDLALDKAEVLSFFEGLSVREETFASKTQYGQETIFYVERGPAA